MRQVEVRGCLLTKVNGLLLLFEQPFKIGDTLDVDGTSGKVVEMNWRSTHLDTGTGIQVIPNATIADASFANYSRPTPAHDHVVTTSFAPADSPHDVMRTLISRGLVSEVGSDPDSGGGLYATTPLFLERLGLTSLADLPELAPLLPETSTVLDEHPDS